MTSAGGSPDSGDKARAGLAGAGGGTGLVALAQTLPLDATWKAILIWASPTVAVLATSLTLFAQIQMNQFLDRRFVMRSRTELEACLNNPHTSEEHKQMIRERLEDLEDVVTTQHLERVKVVSSVGAQGRRRPT